MTYIIQKTVQGKFKYWLDKNKQWTGLKGSANCFAEEAYVERLAEQLKEKDKDALIEIIRIGAWFK